GAACSPGAQIRGGHAPRLAVAWSYRTGELATYRGTHLAEKAAFEATPLMVDGTLYFSTPTDRVIALDAATGAERWVYDPKLDLTRDYSEVTSRGVATWVEPAGTHGQPGYRGLYVGTIDGRLLALDAANGRPRVDFGRDGFVDLKPGAGPVVMGLYQVTSPPTVVGNLVVVGSSVADNQAVKDARGVV